MRCCISWAALFVKVMASMRAGEMPEEISRAILEVSVLVLPVPAPANMSSGPEKYSTASSCLGFRPNLGRMSGFS